jgi:hypothetical protein
MRVGVAAGIGWGALGLIAVVGPATLQQVVGLTSPEVAAIRNHPVAGTATVVEPLIDGIAGDPALAYRYTVSGRTYEGFDIANAETGDVLAMKPGDRVSIIYAGTMPNVSCLKGSTDCPNDIYDPAIPAFGFWAILIVGSVLGCVGIGVVLITRRASRHRHLA